MSDRVEIGLRDGTLVRHKKKGYEGRIEGTTTIKTCFTRNGALLEPPSTKESFQYRVVVSGQTMRYIAPLDDLEILDTAVEIICTRCHKTFGTTPGLTGKAGGRCSCGGSICPACLACQSEAAAENKATSCAEQRKRFLKKLAADKKRVA